MKELHPFPREDRITFNEEKHEYIIDGKKAPRSVTGLLHEYSSDFDPNRALIAMKAGRDWETKKMEMESQNLSTNDDDIIQRWEFNGEIARARGTLLHFHCEQMMNGKVIEEPHSPEFEQAKHIYKHLLGQGLKPYRAEVNLFHCGLQVAGQPDGLFKDKSGNVVIVDWKRSKNIRMENQLNLKYPLEHIPDCNYWLYALQVIVFNINLIFNVNNNLNVMTLFAR